MENSFDFISHMKAEIKEKGVVVLDDVGRMPAYGVDFVQPYYSVSINHSGTVEGLYDGNPFVFAPHDISVLYPRHTLFVNSSSPDYRATLLIISEEFFNHLSFINTSDNRFVFESRPHFRLSDRQYADILSVIEMFRVINRPLYINRGEMLMIMLDLMLGIVGSFRIENVGKGSDHRNRISPLLRDAIMQHCRQHHDVEFYANLFCLSSKHFSSVVKRETGHSVSHWIHQQLVADAKTLLRVERGLPVQDVSDRMGFPDLATFSRFFKRETGMSPTDFRQSL